MGSEKTSSAGGNKGLGKKAADVPAAIAEYLRANHKIQTVPEIAKELKRANGTIYEFMTALGLTPKARFIGNNHPFRQKNRVLEKQLLHIKILKAQAKRSL